MAETSAEIHFAQRLAANDKPTRDRAIKKLRKWLNKKGSFTEVELLKIWKGLHYCMWMQDKPLLQEELAENISQLVHVFSQIETNFLFIQTFFQTEAREWSSIDRWRIDKFMMLVRRVLRQVLLFIKKRKWKNRDIKKLTQILTEYLIKSISDGLKIHFADIYMEELEKAGADTLSADQIMKFLEPFMIFLPTEKNISVAKRYITRVFMESIIQQSIDDAMTAAEKQIQKEEQGDSDNEDSDDLENRDLEDTPRLQFDFEKIADRLFKLGSNKDCIARNRALIYDVVKKLRDLNEGILPVDETVSDASDGEIDNKEIAQAVKRLTALENVDKGGKKNKKKKKNKNKNKANTEDIKINKETEMETENDTAKENLKKNSGEITTQNHIQNESKKKKTKRKLETGEQVETVEIEKTPKKKRKMSETLNEVQKSSSKKLKKETESFTKLKDSSETVSDETNKTTKQKKNKKALTSTTHETSDSNEINTCEKNGQNSVKSSGKKVKKEKLIDSENSVFNESNVSVKNVNKTRRTTISDLDDIKLTVSGVETKKSKGRNSDSGFAKFEKLKKTPPAFVRKAVKKLSTPKTEPRKKKAMGLRISEPPGSAPSGREKRKSVSFDMKSNTTLDFNKDVHLSPATPFNPGQKPEASILKAGLSPSPVTPKVKRQLRKMKKSATPKNRA